LHNPLYEGRGRERTGSLSLGREGQARRNFKEIIKAANAVHIRTEL